MTKMPEEERRVSPAIILIPIAFGLAAVGVFAAMALAAPPKVYPCPYCEAEFATEEELLAHIELEHPEVPVHGVKGDLDNDGLLTTNDLNLLYQAILYLGTPEFDNLAQSCGLSSAEFFWRADVNGDGAVNALDITALEWLIAVAEFVYTSDLIVKRTDYPTIYDIEWTVSVQNIGTGSGVLHLDIFQRMEEPGVPGHWSSWSKKGAVSDTIAPGETKTFTGIVKRGKYTYQLMITSEAGTLLNPTEPGAYICGCCYDLTGKVVSFATQEELDAHFAAAHPEYAPMPQLETFTLRGLSWPDHFYHQSWVNPEREDYGRIILWRATCLLNEADFVNEDGNFEPEFEPTTGKEYVGTDEALEFIMPENWVSARRGPCGIIPNSTWLKLYFRTDRGWSGWLCWSGWLLRIPNGSEITFEVDSERCRNWMIT